MAHLDPVSTDPVLREQMIQVLHDTGELRSPTIAAAFRKVPRHLFVPELGPSVAYADEPQVTLRRGGEPISSISQPTMIAQMLQSGAFGPGQRVLEIGTGRGYNAALVAELVGSRGLVRTVEMEPELVDWSRSMMVRLGYEQVMVTHGDGREGYPEDAPYDRVIVTAGAVELARAWEAQLAVGGRIVVPLAGQRSCVTYLKTAEGLTELSRTPARFLPLRDA